MFLEKREMHLQRLSEEFKKLTVSDEKQDLVNNFLSRLHAEMDNDPLWQSKNDKNSIFYYSNFFFHTKLKFRPCMLK